MLTQNAKIVSATIEKIHFTAKAFQSRNNQLLYGRIQTELKFKFGFMSNSSTEGQKQPNNHKFGLTKKKLTFINVLKYTKPSNNKNIEK